MQVPSGCIKDFFDHVRKTLGRGSLTQTQVDGFNHIFAAWNELAPKYANQKELAYMLGTSWWETGETMEPVRETKASTSDEAVRRLDSAYRKGVLKVSKPYWRTDRNKQSPHGRGYVQLTHPENYERADRELGLKGKLVQNYDLAMDKDIAAKILVKGMFGGWFTTKKLTDYFGAGKYDPVGARRIINGQDKASHIASLCGTFLDAIKAAGIQ